jgi:hypothetical protein
MFDERPPLWLWIFLYAAALIVIALTPAAV